MFQTSFVMLGLARASAAKIKLLMDFFLLLLFESFWELNDDLGNGSISFKKEFICLLVRKGCMQNPCVSFEKRARHILFCDVFSIFFGAPSYDGVFFLLLG